MWDMFVNYFGGSSFGQIVAGTSWGNLVMIGVGMLFIWLAVFKKFEPLLLVPIGFGILIGNIPYDASQVPLSVFDGPASPHDLHYYDVQVSSVERRDGAVEAFDDYRQRWLDNELTSLRETHAEQLKLDDPLLTDATALAQAGKDIPAHSVHFGEAAMTKMIQSSRKVHFSRVVEIDNPARGEELVYAGRAIVVNAHVQLAPLDAPGPDASQMEASAISAGQGRSVLVRDYEAGQRYGEVWPISRQDPYKASVLYWLFAGVGIAGFYPPLIFLGIGALTDFGPMLSNPKTLLLGAAAQLGIFGALLAALGLFGFTMKEAASIGIIGGADGPTAIFTCSTLAPHLLGAVALAAYSYMAMVPIIQPPIMRLCTTRQERLIRMRSLKPVSRMVRITFPIVAFLLTAAIAPAGVPLLGMLFFGNLLRESLVTERLAKTAQTTFIDIVTILLGVTVGAKTQAATFLTWQTIGIFILGISAFAIATAAGVLFARFMNLFLKEKINPLIGAAGVSAVPMAARVAHKVGQDEDPHNFLLMHAMGPNVAGVIGSAVAAGVMLSYFAG
jgi:oxaloacetate decarboxylase beta subunit